MYTVHGTTWLLHHASVTIVYRQHGSSVHWSPWHVSHPLIFLSSYHSSTPHSWYVSYMTASPRLCSPLWHLWLLEQQQLQDVHRHWQHVRQWIQESECKRSASYLGSMRDNLATHHHINSYYIYVHSMDPVCTSWDISPIHVLLVGAVLSLVARHWQKKRLCYTLLVLV